MVWAAIGDKIFGRLKKKRKLKEALMGPNRTQVQETAKENQRLDRAYRKLEEIR
jgi:hypothetical protein